MISRQDKYYKVLLYILISECMFQILQKDQEAEIEHLENEVQTMRKKHSEAIQKLKSSFLREKRGFQKESDSKIQEMAQQATQVSRSSNPGLIDLKPQKMLK